MSDVRLLGRLALVALLTVAVASLPGRDDEKVPDTKPDKGMRTEEEDESYRPGKPVLRVTEPDVADTSARLFPRPAANLKLAAQSTKSVYLRKVYHQLEVPHDVMVFSSTERKEFVRPLDQYVGDRRENIKGGLEVTPFEDDWKPGKARTVAANLIEKVRHYEQLCRDAATEVLANDKDVLRQERLAAAEQLLAAALTFNETARRRTPEWQEVAAGLHRELFGVLLSQLRETGDAKAWDEAAGLARRLFKDYRTEADQVRIAADLSDLVVKALNEPAGTTTGLRDVRQQARRVLDQYESNTLAQSARETLRTHAERLLGQANKAIQDKQLSRADDLAQQAAELDPQARGLRELQSKLNESFPALRVAVRELPVFLSPARATTDSELRAVELLFEGLVKIVPGPDGAVRFRPSLAEGPPRIVPMGREFRLPANAVWAGTADAGGKAKPVTAADVNYSVEKLKEGLGDRPRAWGDLLREVPVGDGSRVTLTLTRGCLEPLALMTFKIIPEGTAAGDDDFAKKPIGSGPHRLGERGKDDRGDYVSFVSNSAYGRRPDRTDLPHIRDIRFYVSKDPVKDLKEGRLDMALDLTSVQAASLAKESRILVPPPGPNRRVYFLAVNHKAGSILANADIRFGLALAINREELLDEHFRKDLGKGYHKALNGPFPAGSWACKPVSGDKSLDPFRRDLAESRISKGLDDARARTTEQLSLLYPTGDPKLADALNDLRKQVLAASKGRIVLDPKPLSAHDLRKAVEGGQYDLAYYHYDFPDETYWLGPLLGQDGKNVMNYRGSDLQRLIREAAIRREFDEVRKQVAAMHSVLDRDMPLIPLWQLDPLSAYREDLKPTDYDSSMGPRKNVERVPYDPLLVFTDAENWRLQRQ
jgi:ABC-type transport system substrate-binding protein